ncbi:MAG: TVP38/TMEM64 family protein [Spirochaetia bacterium]|jgi:uncharacterized membrane protein YdjX (TVP38/TMEM64 family)
MRKLNAKKLLVLAAFPLLIAAVVIPVIVWHDALWSLFSSPQVLRDWVEGWGAWAPAIFIALQSLQVIVFAIPGEVAQIAGGYLFGTWQGTLLSVAGILIGSTTSFFLARALGRPFVAAIAPAAQVEKIEKLLGSRSARVVFFLLFLIPGIPKDILCYVAGLTPMGFPFFVGASMVGRLPGIVGSSVIGSAAASSKWVLAGIVGAAAAALFGAGVILRPRIQNWIERLAGKGGPPTGS